MNHVIFFVSGFGIFCLDYVFMEELKVIFQINTKLDLFECKFMFY